MENRDERLQKELAYQAERASKISPIRRTPDYLIERYRKNKLWWVYPKELAFKALKNVAEKEVLDFGCGEGEITTQLARLGARVTAVDISPELIEIAKRRADLDGVRDRIEFITGDITRSPLSEKKFDVFLAVAVLHHVEIRSTLPLLCSSLKPSGMAIIVEPIGFSPLLQKIRTMIPVEADAGPFDRPLNRSDLDFIVSSFADCRVTFFDLFGRLQRLFPKKAAAILFAALDRFFLTVFPPLSKFSGEAVIIGRKPSIG